MIDVAGLDQTCRELSVPIVPGGAMQQPLGLVSDLAIWRRVTKAWQAVEATKGSDQPPPAWAHRTVVEIEAALREQQALAELRELRRG